MWSSCLPPQKDTEQTQGWAGIGQAVSRLWFWWIPSSLLRQSVLMKWITLIICHLASTVAQCCTVHSARASLGRVVSLAAPECVQCDLEGILCYVQSWTDHIVKNFMGYSRIKDDASDRHPIRQLLQDFQTLRWCFWWWCFRTFLWLEDFSFNSDGKQISTYTQVLFLSTILRYYWVLLLLHCNSDWNIVLYTLFDTYLLNLITRYWFIFTIPYIITKPITVYHGLR